MANQKDSPGQDWEAERQNALRIARDLSIQLKERGNSDDKKYQDMEIAKLNINKEL